MTISYSLSDENFYKMMEEKRREIDGMDIPDSERRELYARWGETIVRHEDNQVSFGRIEKGLKGIVTDLSRLPGLAEELVSSSKKIAENCERIVDLGEKRIEKAIEPSPN